MSAIRTIEHEPGLTARTTRLPAVGVAWGSAWRAAALAVMVGALAVYVLLHSPARGPIAALAGTQARGCFFCPAEWAPVTGSVSALALVALVAIAACVLVGRFPSLPGERPLVFGLVAAGLLTGPAAAVGLAADVIGQPLLRPPAGPLLAAVPAALVVGAALVGGWRPPPLVLPAAVRASGLVQLLAALAALLVGAALAISLVHPPTSGDALGYHAPLAVFLWADGSLGAFLDRAPVAWALAHPGVAELWYGLLGVVGGEGAADLGQAPLALLGAAAAAAFARRLGLRVGAARLAGAGFLLAPMVVLQAGTQANDVAGAAFLMSTAALAAVSPTRWSGSRAAVVGMGLGLVATTKLALLPGVAAVALFVAVVLVRARGARRAAPLLALLAVAGLAMVAPWWGRNLIRFANPLFPSALPFLGRGVFVPDFGHVDIAFVPGPAAWPLYPMMEAHDDRSGFGALVLVGVLPGIVSLISRRIRPPLVLFGLVTTSLLAGWWFATLHEPRFLLAAVGLGMAFIPWALLGVPRGRRRWAGAVLAGAALFSAGVTTDQGLLALTRHPVDRAAFYDTVWAVDPAAAGLPEAEGLLLHTGFAPPQVPEYAAYYPLLGPGRGRLVVPVDGRVPASQLAAQMRAAGIRYAYVLASPAERVHVAESYPPELFELVHASAVVPGEQDGTRRSLFRTPAVGEEPLATQRLLFRLR